MICDTGALLAAFAADQQHHEECADALSRAVIRYVSPVTLTEVGFTASRLLGSRTAETIMRLLSGPNYTILPYTSVTLATASEVMQTYRDMNIGLVDASLVAHAKDLGTNEILTLDQRRFRAIRGLDGKHFKLLPFDAD